MLGEMVLHNNWSTAHSRRRAIEGTCSTIWIRIGELQSVLLDYKVFGWKIHLSKQNNLFQGFAWMFSWHVDGTFNLNKYFFIPSTANSIKIKTVHANKAIYDSTKKSNVRKQSHTYS